MKQTITSTRVKKHFTKPLIWWGWGGLLLALLISITQLNAQCPANPWTSRTSAADNSWQSITYGNGVFVAVSQDGTSNSVMTSPDGISWTSRTSITSHNWWSVTYGNGLFVAVSYSGTGNNVMTSPDGITWTSRTSAADNEWNSVTYGNGLFVAVASSGTGNRVMTSPDGITWTIRTSAANNYWNAVTYANNVFVAVAQTGTGNRVMTSTDGITWTSRTSVVNNQWTSVIYGNGLFVAVAGSGPGNQIMTSPDGITWTDRTAAANSSWYSVTYGNGLFVAVANSGSVMTSPDGINWTIQTSAAANQWRSVTYGNGLFVAVSQTGTGNSVMTSSLPLVTPSVTIAANPGNSITTGASVTFTATPTNGGSTPAYQWKKNSNNVGTNSVTYTDAALQNGDIITCLLTSNNPCASPATVTSTSITMTVNYPCPAGTTWTSRTSAADNQWLSVTYGNGLFVAVANTGTGNRIMTSPNGINWTIRTSAADNQWTSVTYGNGLFVAVAGAGNRVMTSLDGITWTIRTSAADNVWYSITYGNGLFVAVAASGTGNRVMTSPDGITWTIRNSAADNSWYSVTYGNGLFVAVAYSGTGNRVMTSPDGITWTIRTSAANNIWNSVTYGNGLFVAVAASGTGNRVMTSPDGITWTSRTSAADNFWNSVTYGNGLFVAVANTGTGNRVMTSPNGITWTSRTSAADNTWYSITYGNGLFVAVSYTGTGNRVMTSSQPLVTPSVSIAANTGNSITTGTSVTFTATPTNGGTTPAYQWKKNGNNVGSNSATYTDAALANGNFITCVITSNNPCASITTATSTSITMAIIVIPSVSIVANPGNSITKGASVTFTATPTNGGSTPGYQWKKNNNNVGNNSVTYTDAALENGDILTCVLTSNHPIASPTTATSTGITMAVNYPCPAGTTWASQTSAADNQWTSVTYGNGLFVAVAGSGTGNRVMTSTDGINWTSRTSAADNSWFSVTYGNGLFVAVSYSGTGNRVMTSPDGINWTSRTSAADNIWYSVTYGNGLFVAVSNNGTGNRVMTSPDGITWTIRTSAANNIWTSVTYGNGLFVAVANSGTANRVMTSPNGITWTSRTSAADNQWYSVTYGNGLFVAVSITGTGNRVMTSPNGITWTSRTSAADNQWYSVTYGNGLFVAVAGTGTMTSPDGITWTIRTSAAENAWNSVTYGNGLFVAVAYTGTGNRVMTSFSLFTTSTTNTSICPNALPYSWNGTAYSTTGTYSKTFTAGNSKGCDSVATLNLTINNATISTNSATACGSYLWNGITYTTSGAKTFSTTNSKGCDSVATLNLTINSVTTSSNTASVCSNQLPYSWNGLTFNAAGTLTKTGLINSKGCDSAATLTLSVATSSAPTVSVSASANNVCSNVNVTFTAIATNEGTAPVYQWKKNGVNVGSGSSITFLGGTINKNDSVWCVLTNNSACATSPTATSSKIKMIIKTSPVVSPVKSNTGAYITNLTMCNPGSSSTLYNTYLGGTWSSSNPAVATAVNGVAVGGVSSSGLLTAVANGTTEITYSLVTASTGCGASASLTVFVDAVPTLNAIAGGSNGVCIGNSIALSNSSTIPAGGSAVWASTAGRATVDAASGVLTGVNAGTASIKYAITNANGCNNSTTSSITVNSFPSVPSIGYAVGTVNPQTGPAGAFCNNRTFTVLGNPLGGVWSTTNASVVIVNSAGLVNTVGVGFGSVVYTYTNANGCSSNRSIVGTVAACASRSVNWITNEKQETRNEFTMYPNPAKTFIRLNVEALIGTGTIVVTDLYGKQVKAQALSMGTNTIDITNLAKGIYFVSTITSEGKVTKKLVVE